MNAQDSRAVGAVEAEETDDLTLDVEGDAEIGVGTTGDVGWLDLSPGPSPMRRGEGGGH
ncbi:MAG: hypothetical protein OJF49_000794 [Ktedonobacterales bacterium]|jgi:hypothetical protein|nr:MAG: hypothetical protein OJF49_000794 [Ktedonobacterales bacterium]